MAFAAPNPKPEPKPQYLAYSGLDYAVPAAVPGYVSPYAAAPLAYSAYSAYPGAYYVR